MSQATPTSADPAATDTRATDTDRAEQPQLHIDGYDAVEFWVGNARQAAHFYRSAFGFELTGYAGPETGVTDRCSYVVDQGEIRLVLTAALDPGHPIADHHRRHGDGVRDVALRVTDAQAAFEAVVARGAAPLQEPTVHEDDHGKLVVAAISVYGDTVHSLVERSAYDGVHRPGYVALEEPLAHGEVGLRRIDHVVANVAEGQMDHWARFYQQTLGLQQLHHFDADAITTDASALMSKVLADGRGRIKLPINEPAEGPKRSQIEEFLDAYGGPGVQHLALETDDIVGTVAALRARGVGFLTVPPDYYRDARARVGDVDESWDDLERLGVLVDRDEQGYLLQIFTDPVQDRPTLFYEVIQRQGARGFGEGNFRALFEAIERAQARRGNL